ncbi:MAG: hypothetical protein A2857_03985 [Candidatus Levybacteria bacterium RIFCSPHIGHO2_01_FULL_36_15]|nr:MAG: hypothetical protein A2857_03985 [Candidatus Levybacteria bacterium RIFCSPHIGHO2_01_FULL_36_15]OGH39173.1 MAG: hypothetical protein A2905_03075 [Candidatus Levybacteria bacterium RIFCSPLOWO2_01_FULL_36_10]
MSKEDLAQTLILVQVENYALQFLSQGRKEWDIPHTRSVVHYANEIGQSVNLDLLVEKTAAWFHDIGYFYLFEGGDSNQKDAVRDRKARHMTEGTRLAKEFLDRSDIAKHYRPDQASRIVHLVGKHDRVVELTDLDELVLMEADTLGTLDLTSITPTYDYNDAVKYLESVRRKRVPRFTTQLGKRYLEDLLPKFEEYLQSKRT